MRLDFIEPILILILFFSCAVYRSEFKESYDDKSAANNNNNNNLSSNHTRKKKLLLSSHAIQKLITFIISTIRYSDFRPLNCVCVFVCVKLKINNIYKL